MLVSEYIAFTHTGETDGHADSPASFSTRWDSYSQSSPPITCKRLGPLQDQGVREYFNDQWRSWDGNGRAYTEHLLERRGRKKRLIRYKNYN